MYTSPENKPSKNWKYNQRNSNISEINQVTNENRKTDDRPE
jgi:hypothetical protein